MSGHCITVDVFELRSCVLVGQHRPNCDGHARRHRVVERYDREAAATFRAHLTDILDDPCAGCAPRPAVDGGYLCEPHVRRVEDAIARLPELAANLWAFDGAGTAVDDGVRVHAFESRIPIPSSRVLARELFSAATVLLDATLTPDMVPTPLRLQLRPMLPSVSAYSTLGEVVEAAVEASALLARVDDMVWRRRSPARAAVEFVRVASIAYRAFPIEDTPHRIPALRCRTCGRLALEWHPPLYYLDDDSVRCGVCGAVEDRSLYEHDVAVILAARAGRNTR